MAQDGGIGTRRDDQSGRAVCRTGGRSGVLRAQDRCAGWSAVGREFSLATNQVDFVQPARFELTYVDRDGSEKTPLCIHRAPLGSHERFVGFLIEHYGGAFPLWLAPVQAVVIPIADRHVDYAYRVRTALRSVGLRVDVDDGPERMNKKIRNAQQQRCRTCWWLGIGNRPKQHLRSHA